MTTPDTPQVRSQQTPDSMDLAEDQAGPLTVLRSPPGATPHTPRAPVLPRDALPSRQSTQRPITVMDLAPRESSDGSLDSDSSEGSDQWWRILSLITLTAVLSSRLFQSFSITALGAWMFIFHFFTALPCCPTLLCLLLFKTPPPDNRFFQHSRDLCPSPSPLLAAHG